MAFSLSGSGGLEGWYHLAGSMNGSGGRVSTSCFESDSKCWFRGTSRLYQLVD